MKYAVLLLLISVIHVSHSFADSAASVESKLLKRLCEESPRPDKEILNLYREGMVPLELLKDNSTLRDCLLKTLRGKEPSSLYCKLQRALRRRSRRCREFQEYMIHPASPKDLIDLVLTYRDSSRQTSDELRMITEELSLINMPESSALTKGMADHYYRLVSFSNGNIDLYLNSKFEYQLFNRLTGRRQRLKVDTELKPARVMVAQQTGAPVETAAEKSVSTQNTERSFSQTLSDHKLIIGGTLLAAGIVATVLLTREPETRANSFNTSN